MENSFKHTVDLIKNVEYDKEYVKVVDSKGNFLYYDGNEYNCRSINLCKDCYTSEAFVEDTEEINKIADIIVSKFEDIFLERGIKATKDQLYFARETAKVVLGKSLEDVIAAIPAPCGFGKSTIKLLIVKYYISLYEDNKSNDGIIIVGDRLEDLRELQRDLKALSKYTYLLQAWNEEVCLAKYTKQEIGMCLNCDEYRCPIKQQRDEVMKHPIILMTNARLREMGESIEIYESWYKHIKSDDVKEMEKHPRKLLMIDEKTEIIDSIKVDKKLLNEIDTYISKVEFSDDELINKTELQEYWNDILNIWHEEVKDLRDYKRRVYVGRYNGKNFCEDNSDFMKLFNKYCKKYLRELDQIHKVFTKGGLFVREGSEEFICTIGKKELKESLCKSFKTVIFDGSSLYDPQYLALENNLRYLYIPNSRTYENLKIDYKMMHKITRTEFNNKRYLKKACSEFLRLMDKELKGKIYPITYKSVSNIGEYCGGNLRSNIMKLDSRHIFHFGGTKGSNAMSEAVNMIQLGWDTMPDYEYVIQYLCCCCDFDFILDKCRCNNHMIETLSNALLFTSRDSKDEIIEPSQNARYCFGIDAINIFKWLDIVSKFFQEVHRTKLRQYDCKDKVNVVLFKTAPVIIDMIEALFPGCKVIKNRDVISCFSEAKTMDRKAIEGKEKTNPQILLEYLGGLEDGRVVKMKDIILESGLTRDQIKGSKKSNLDIKSWFKNHKAEKNGQYVV